MRRITTTKFRALGAALLAVAASAFVAPTPAHAQAEPPASGAAYIADARWDRSCQVRFTSPNPQLWVTDNASLDTLAAMRCDDVAVIQVINVRDADPAVAERPHDLQVLFVTYVVQAPDVVCAARVDGFVFRGVSANIGSQSLQRTLSGCGATVTLPNTFLFSCITGSNPVTHRCGSVLRP